MFFVGLSITVFVLETHKLFQIDKISGKGMYEIEPEDDSTPTGYSPTTCCCEAEGTTESPIETDPVTHPVLEVRSLLLQTLAMLLFFV